MALGVLWDFFGCKDGALLEVKPSSTLAEHINIVWRETGKLFGEDVIYDIPRGALIEISPSEMPDTSARPLFILLVGANGNSTVLKRLDLFKHHILESLANSRARIESLESAKKQIEDDLTKTKDKAVEDFAKTSDRLKEKSPYQQLFDRKKEGDLLG